MNKWPIIIGYVLAVSSPLLLSPLADYLPIDLWMNFKSIFYSEKKHTYYKVVPGEAGFNYAIVTLILGTVIILFGKFWKRNNCE